MANVPAPLSQNASLEEMKQALLKASDYLATLPKNTPVPPPPATINSQNTAPSTPIAYTTPTPTPTYPVGALNPAIPTPPATMTAPEVQANDLTKRLQTLNDSLVGMSAYQTEKENEYGLPDLYKTQNDLSSQLTGLQNEAKAIPIQLQSEAEGRGITAAGLAPIQSAQLRNNAVKALTVSTLLEATKGNIATAQMMADRAVAQKYGPIQEQITAAKSNLDLILKSPEYTLADKNRAQAQLDIQNQRQIALDQIKSDAKAVSDLSITAAQNTASFKPTAKYSTVAVALQAISSAKTPAEAQSIATETGLVKPADLDTQVVEVGGRKLLIDSKTGATIKDLGAVPKGSSGSSGGTEAERAANATARFSAAFVPGASLPSGVPVLDSDGYLTPEAFRAAIADAPANGLTREKFLESFGYLITTPDGKISPKYGLTPNEIKVITGALPNG